MSVCVRTNKSWIVSFPELSGKMLWERTFFEITKEGRKPYLNKVWKKERDAESRVEREKSLNKKDPDCEKDGKA